MKKYFLVALTLFFLFITTVAMAQPERKEAKIEAKGGNIAVMGNAGKSNTDLIITIEDSNGKALQSQQLTTSADGSFDVVVPVSDTSESDVYTVVAQIVESDDLDADDIQMIAASLNIDGNFLTVNGTASSGAEKKVGILVENSEGNLVYVVQDKTDSEGKFRKTFPLSYNIEGEIYTVYIGANGIDTHSVLTFEYTDRTTETVTRQFLDANLSIELSSYVPHLTGTISCSQGKTVDMTITNISNNTLIATETVSFSDGAKTIDYTLQSLLNPKDYALTFVVSEGSKILTTINAQIDSAIVLTAFEGNVTVGEGVSLEVTFSSDSSNIDDNYSVITEDKTFSSSVPNLLSNGNFTFDVNGFEVYTKANVMDIKDSENPSLYNALKVARPNLDSDNDGIITSAEMEDINGVLDISNAGITNLAGIGQCTKVRYLDISDNNLTDIDVLSTMTSLEYLIADHNYLTDLHGAPESLRYIDASYNQLSGLMGIKDSNNLEVVIAHYNNIKSLEGLQSKNGLRYLKINNNNIDNMDSISDCSSLVHLDFAHNSMNNVKALAQMFNLKYLNFDDNPVESVKELPDNDYALLRYWADWITDGYIRTIVTNE